MTLLCSWFTFLVTEDRCVRSLQREVSAIGSRDKRTWNKCLFLPTDKKLGPCRYTCPHSSFEKKTHSLSLREPLVIAGVIDMWSAGNDIDLSRSRNRTELILIVSAFEGVLLIRSLKEPWYKGAQVAVPKRMHWYFNGVLFPFSTNAFNVGLLDD